MEKANLKPRPPETKFSILISIRMALIAFTIWLIPIITCIYLMLNSH